MPKIMLTLTDLQGEITKVKVTGSITVTPRGIMYHEEAVPYHVLFTDIIAFNAIDDGTNT